jgi:two-component system, cell cycle sensor histidine kinase and response regulator CckA
VDLRAGRRMVYREVKIKAFAAVRERIEAWRPSDATLNVLSAASELRARLSPDPGRRELESQRVELRAYVDELLAAKQALEVEIEHREAVEAKLRTGEARLEAIIDNSAAFIFVKDRAFRYVQINRHFANFGLDGQTVIGRDDFEVFGDESARQLRANDEEVLATRAPIQVRESLARDGVLRHFLSVKFPVFDGSGEIEGIGGIATEITAMITADQERQRMQAKMLEAQKLESLGVLAGGVAHDFNNLLTGILGNVTLALFELGPRHRASSLIEQIEVAALKASDLTRQLLAYAGKGKFIVEPLDLSRLVSEMSTLLQTTVPKKVRLDFELEGQLPPVEGDARQLHQVVMNLVLNGAEAIGEAEGLVTVRTSLVASPPEEAPAGRAAPLPKGAYVRIEVSDSGLGMDAETVGRIFDPFFTTKFAGRGLGLPALLGIVGAHRGAVYVRSSPGLGSTFRVYLPVADPAKRASETSRLSPSLEGRFEGMILVVDDEHLSRAATASMLRKLGFRVLESTDGVFGVEAFRDNVDEVRLVLLDLTMPRMGGEEVLAAIRSLRHDVPVVVMSGFAREDVVRRFGSLPPSGVLEKPFSVDDLIVEILEHVEQPMAADAR